MLELTDVSAGYGQAKVVRDVTVHIGQGEMVALLGRNGMGKTTLLHAVFGLADRHAGNITLARHTVPSGRPDLLARWGATLMPEDRGVFPNLTITDNLRLANRKGFRPAVDPRELFPLLTDRRDQLAGTLSGGQKQQVGIARAILAGQSLIAIDELTQGLQPSLVRAVLEALRTITTTGVTVVVVDQHAALLLEYCPRTVVMQAGRAVFDGPGTPRSRLDELLALS
ncbi:ABC-type branched-subunit amino acid transport system ATPase component [Kibdelosporangium banguiense]|uniref:ABC-type branched-subunit amino acid transport system ATPase component n=1 Tax=Kibdelosporangium banguiense TaxID=1365924 RepID=A0ABS4TVC3_9PSEU|nr:ATP-binding cassette domain-containing protein [Kibdelosporangium banguiense]MBP2328371.1 ABC-type branched-subunit amino acid transport system ATPase component [Kibdelosporangium banguiense]